MFNRMRRVFVSTIFILASASLASGDATSTTAPAQTGKIMAEVPGFVTVGDSHIAIPKVRVQLKNDADPKIIFEALSDDSGKFTFYKVPEAKYTATVLTLDLAKIVREHIEVHDATEIKLVARDGELHGVVSDSNNTPIKAARLELVSLDKEVLYVGTSSENGSFRFEYIPLGKYKFVVLGPTHNSKLVAVEQEIDITPSSEKSMNLDVSLQSR